MKFIKFGQNVIVLDFIEYLVHSFITYIRACLHIDINVFVQIGRIYILYNLLSASVIVDVNFNLLWVQWFDHFVSLASSVIFKWCMYNNHL